MGEKSSGEKSLKTAEKPSELISETSNIEASFSDTKTMLLHWLLLGVLVFGVYANSIHSEFVWDDIQLIKENPDIKSFSNVFRILLSEDAVPDAKTNYYRPVTYLSFMLDYALWDSNPKGFHAVNIFLHLLFSCLLYLFVRDILGTSGAALTSSLIFALHPAVTETVNFIAGGRNTLLCGVFLLAALLSHRKGRLMLTLLFFTLSAFSKEFGLLFPVIAIFTDMYFPRASHDKAKDIKTFALYTAVIVFYLLMRGYVIGGSGFDIKPETLSARVLLIPQIIFTYLKVIFIPYPLTLPYYFDMPEGINTQIVFHAFLLIAVMYLAYHFRRSAAVSFSSLWFLIFILPVLNIIPLGHILAAERYIYIALAGFAIFLGAVSEKLKRPVVVPALIVVGLLYSVVVVTRNPVWKDSYTLFSDAVKKAPDDAFMRSNLGIAYAELGRIDEAIKEYQTALKLDHNYAEAHNFLGIAYASQGRLDEAIKEYQTAITIKPEYAEVHNNLGIAYANQGRLDEAIKEYQAALKISSNNVETHNNLGLAYETRGRINEAIKEYQAAIKIKPDYVEPHNNLGIVYANQGKIDEAIKEFKAVIEIKPDYVEGHNNLGAAFENQGKIDEAIKEFKAAIEIKPDYHKGHYNLGLAYDAQGRIAEAIIEYKTALRLNPDDKKTRQKLDFLIKK
jgi:tetratricopeptide (TPR) repeat protein